MLESKLTKFFIISTWILAVLILQNQTEEKSKGIKRIEDEPIIRSIHSKASSDRELSKAKSSSSATSKLLRSAKLSTNS